jgi:hypothetical protein
MPGHGESAADVAETRRTSRRVSCGDHLPECAALSSSVGPRAYLCPSVRLTIHSSLRRASYGSSRVRPTLERKATLIRARSPAAPKVSRGCLLRGGLQSELIGHPFQDIRSQPADLSSAISALLRKPAQQDEAGNDQLRATSKPRDVMGAEELLEWRERLVDPSRERDARAVERARRRLRASNSR